MPETDENQADDAGAGGEIAVDKPDIRLMSRAIVERWPMSERVRAQVLKRLTKVLNEDAWDEGEKPKNREVIAASKALLAADKLNLEYMKFEHETNLNQELNEIRVTIVEHVKSTRNDDHPALPAPCPAGD